jgi:hypothetical protein
MSRRAALSFTAIAAAAFVLAAVAGRASAEDRCYGEWSDAAPIVAREKLRSARDVQDGRMGTLTVSALPRTQR